MSRCEGLVDQPCPHNRRGEQVRLCQGDLMLCRYCEDVRFNNTYVKQVEQVENMPQCDDHHSDNPVTIVDALLSYVLFSLQNSNADSVRNAVLGHFTADQILHSKNSLWDKCSNEIIGEKMRRKDSVTRPEKEAHTQDIITAISKLDKSDNMPTILINAQDLHLIPRSHPEELNNISLVDRLNRMEKRMTNLQEVMDRTVCENMALNEKVNNLTSYSSIVKRPVITVSNTEGATNEIKNLWESGNNNSTNQTKETNYVETNENNEHEERNKFLEVNTTNRRTQRGRGNNRFTSGRGGMTHKLRSGEHFSRTPSLLSLDRYSETSKGSRVFGNEKLNRDRSHDSDGFELPPYMIRQLKKQDNRKKRIITGNKENGKFRGAPEPNRDLFIYRADKDTRSADLSSHLKDHGFHVRNIDCVSHPDSKFKSFRVTLPLSEFKDVFDSAIWPSGVRVRKYVPPKQVNYDYE